MANEDLLALAERCEGRDWTMEDQAEVCAVFGVHQQRLERAGWKRWYEDSGRWGAPVRPLQSLDDLRHLLERAGCLPDLIIPDPRKATAAALRARASQEPPMTDTPIHLYAHGERDKRDRSQPFAEFLNTKEKWAETMAMFPDRVRYHAANLAAHNWDVALVGERLLICCVWSGGDWWGKDGSRVAVTADEMDLLYPQVPKDTRGAQTLYPSRGPGGAYQQPIYRQREITLNRIVDPSHD